MNRTFFKVCVFSVTSFLVILHSPIASFSQSRPAGREIVIHLRGVYDSRFSLLGLSGSRLFKPVVEVSGTKNGETARLQVPAGEIPSEFVLRCDYREKETDTPYPSEKTIFMNNQDLELWISPKYSNNPDSTWFQKGETENATFFKFSGENGARKEKLGVLQQFLMNYDDTSSALFKQAITEYEQRRGQYNAWLQEQRTRDSALFISNLYGFQWVPQIPWTGTEKDRVRSLIRSYFDGIDFGNPMLLRTASIFKWMDSYVNLHGQLATTVELRDSLFPAAGRNAIEKAKNGHPKVYGWMVDYFFRGYEQNGIDAGTRMLQPYLDDPNCLTSKRMEIERRLKGMETLTPGADAPGFSLPDPDGGTFDFSSFKTKTRYILLFFWSADCSHCAEMAGQIYPWLEEPAQKKKVDVVAVSLDETETEINKWQEKRPTLPGWKHLRAAEGVRSQVAADYYILATPVMVLIDAKTRKVVALPNALPELIKSVQ